MKRIVSLWLPRWPANRHARAQQRIQDQTLGQEPERLSPYPSAPPAESKPLVFAATVKGAVRVTAMNGAAQGEGLHVGMGLADARAVLPSLRVEQSDIKADEKALGSLARWCGRYTPWTTVDPHGANPLTGGRDSILMDVTGCAHLFGGEAELLTDLMARLKGFDIEARAALADTPGAAWAVSRYGGRYGEADKAGISVTPEAGNNVVPPGAYTVVPLGGNRNALAPLPVSALRFEPEVVANFDRLGLRKVQDLLALPRAPLARRFGPRIVRRIDQALGHEDEPISPVMPVVPYRARLTFLEPVGRVDDIIYALGTLLDQLCPLLDQDQKGVRRLTLDLFRVDGEVKTITVGTSRPVRAPDHLARLFAGHLEQVDAGFGIDAAVLSAVLTEPLLEAQVRLPGAVGGEKGGENRGDLNLLVDQLGNRLGMDKVRRFEARESFVPERAVVTVPIGAPIGAPMTAPIATQGVPEFVPVLLDDETPLWPAHLKRPLRLLPEPELVQVVAEVPDGPPVLFRWRRGTHRIARVEGPERIGPEWWRAEGPGSRQARDYYRIEDNEGRRFWLFREGLYATADVQSSDALGAQTSRAAGRDTPPPRWYLHGMFA